MYNWRPYSLGGNDLTPGSVTAHAPGDSFYNQSPVQPIHSNVADNYPTYATRVLGPRELTIMHQMTSKADIATLNAIYDIRLGEQTLIVEDIDDGNKQYYMPVTVSRQPRITGMLYTATLKASIGIWRSVLQNSDDTWNPTASGDTHLLNFTQGGNVPAQPTITITPQSQKGSGYSYSRYVIMTSPWDVRRDGWFDLTDGGLDTAALVSGGKAQADGDDFGVLVDGKVTDRRFGTSTHAFNQTGTYVQARVPLSPRIEIPLATAIAGTGALTEIELSTSNDYKKLWDRLPERGTLLIGSEVLSWTSKSKRGNRLEGTITREVFGTSMGAHSVGDTCYWVEHEIQFVYGDSSAAAPSFDSTRAPMWDNSSSSLSHVFTTMTDAAGLRPDRWAGVLSVTRGKDRGTSRLYTAAANTEADPATVLGIYAASWKSGSRDQDETIDAEWRYYNPQGFTTVTATGQKRRTSTSWPTFTFEVSTNGKTWVVVWTEATPSGTTDEAWSSHSSVALGATYYYARFRMKGSVQAGDGYYAYSELNDITFTIASKPTVTVGSENAAAYPMAARITNNTNGQSFSFARTIEVGESVSIVLGPKTRYITYSKDGTRGPRIEYDPATQTAPLFLEVGANTLMIEDADLDDADVTVTSENWVL